MRKVVQITNEQGQPVSGHVFEAPNEESLAASMSDLPEGRWHEVPDEADLIIQAPPPEMDSAKTP